MKVNFCIYIHRTSAQNTLFISLFLCFSHSCCTNISTHRTYTYPLGLERGNEEQEVDEENEIDDIIKYNIHDI